MYVCVCLWCVHKSGLRRLKILRKIVYLFGSFLFDKHHLYLYLCISVSVSLSLEFDIHTRGIFHSCRLAFYLRKKSNNP